MRTRKNDSPKVSLKLDKSLKGKCTYCGKIKHQLELKFLPETEQAIRKFALKKISIEEMNSFNTNMICKKCLKKMKTRNSNAKRRIAK